MFQGLDSLKGSTFSDSAEVLSTGHTTSKHWTHNKRKIASQLPILLKHLMPEKKECTYSTT